MCLCCACLLEVKLTVTHEPIAPIEELDVLAERLV